MYDDCLNVFVVLDQLLVFCWKWTKQLELSLKDFQVIFVTAKGNTGRGLDVEIFAINQGNQLAKRLDQKTSRIQKGYKLTQSPKDHISVAVVQPTGNYKIASGLHPIRAPIIELSLAYLWST
jgi:hypothetical protein